MNELFLGLDIGTSAVKAALFDAAGTELAAARIPQPLASPRPGWAEQDPTHWQAGAWQALRQLSAVPLPTGQSLRDVAAVGLTGQCPSHVLVDGRGQPLGPAIIWRDGRATQEALWLQEHIPAEQANAWTGSPRLGDPSLPPARLLWLRKNRPADWEKTRAILQPKDWIGLLLTGEAATDVHSAFCMAHPVTGAYAPRYLDLLGVPARLLPDVRPAAALLGKVSPAGEVVSGLRAGAPVVVGTIDAYCETIAGGGLTPGRAVDVAGASEIVSLGVVGEPGGEGVFLAKLGGEGQFLCGPTQAGSETLRWLFQGFYQPEHGCMDFELHAIRTLEAHAGGVPPGSRGLVFLPYLSGERAPLWDAAARGAYLGVAWEHDRAHFSRATYEGVGYAIRHILETCEAACGQSAEALSVCGGGSANQFWNQVKADILQLPLFPAGVRETACLGAAMLAAVAVGVHPDLQQAGREMAHPGAAIEPRREYVPVYEDGYRLYRAYYPALGGTYRGLSLP